MHSAHVFTLSLIVLMQHLCELIFFFQAMGFPLVPFGCFGGMVSILNINTSLIFGDMVGMHFVG